MAFSRFAELAFNAQGVRLQGEVSGLSRDAITVRLATLPARPGEFRPGDRAVVTMAAGGPLYRGNADLVSFDGATMVLRASSALERTHARNAPRCPVHIAALVRWRRSQFEWGPWIQTMTHDVSLGGVSVLLRVPEAVPCGVEVNLGLPPLLSDHEYVSESIKASGRATNRRPGPDGSFIVGIALALPPHDVLRLARLMEPYSEAR